MSEYLKEQIPSGNRKQVSLFNPVIDELLLTVTELSEE